MFMVLKEWNQSATCIKNLTLTQIPYVSYMSLHQDLYGDDFLKRENFCNQIRRNMRTEVSFLSHMLFSEEANCANTENVNRHNMHYWANDNSRWMRTVPFQHPWSVNCWCGIVGDHVIDPYVLVDGFMVIFMVSGSFENDYSDMFRFFDYFHTSRDYTLKKSVLLLHVNHDSNFLGI